jgi:hypothetical protein
MIDQTSCRRSLGRQEVTLCVPGTQPTSKRPIGRFNDASAGSRHAQRVGWFAQRHSRSERRRRGYSGPALDLSVVEEWRRGLIAIVCVAAICHTLAQPVHCVGFALPIFVPPVAAITAAIVSWRLAAPEKFIRQ